MYRLLIAALSAALILLLPTLALAQVTTLGATPKPVQYVVSPEVPKPGDTVNIEVQGVGNFLGNSPVTWTQDGKVVQDGTGDSSYTFTVGELGHTTTVSVIIRSQEYGTITQNWTFNPSLVNLVWEAQTTVPPLYMGKALYSAGSALTVTAFPEVMRGAVRIPESQLSFQWTLDDQAKPSQSGLGRSQFTFNGDELRQSETVSVNVLSGNAAVAHDEITIPATAPEILLYARDPLRGILYNSALPNSYQMPGQEITIHAEPYYFSRASLARGQLGWNWTINNNPTSGPNSNLGELTLRAQGSAAGSATLGVSLQNSGPTTFLQAAQSSLSLLFGNTQKQNTIFGI